MCLTPMQADWLPGPRSHISVVGSSPDLLYLRTTRLCQRLRPVDGRFGGEQSAKQWVRVERRPGMMLGRRWVTTSGLVVAIAAALVILGSSPGPTTPSAHAAPAGAPNIFVYNLDDLRDVFPGGIDPLQYMPKVRQWMASGTRYTQSFVADPSCCPSRSSLMTGRYPHNNGVLKQSDGAKFDGPHSMACYFQNNGYATYEDGKFLTTWPKSKLPPCFTHSTVMWGGYFDVPVKVDGVSQTGSGYSTTYLGNRGRSYITQALSGTKPFLLYETPQAPHWVKFTTNGVVKRLARPDTK